MDKDIIIKNLDAMDKYSAKWKSPFWLTTRDLYAKAATTSNFGCHLQDEVLTRLGATIEGHKTRKRYGHAAQVYIDWMTK